MDSPLLARLGQAFRKRREALGDVSAVNLEPDDGLTPGERNVRASVAREKAAKQAKDIELDEAAHIMADQVALLEKHPRLAHEVLPKEAFTRPVSVADSASSQPPVRASVPASAGSSH